MASGTELATAYVSLVVSTGNLAPSMSKSFGGIEKLADDSGKKAGKRWGSGIATAAKAALGAAVLIGGIDFIKESIAEARESQKVGALTTQIIKSTGGAAKISADQVGALATSISNKTGVDDEAIQSGANMLLTFKNVRNEVGAGSKIFDRATMAASDLSAAGFGDMTTTSKQLGKALNDPLKGISALAKSGVTFTEQQKEQIKTLVASGKTLEAQKIILGEVESQVGGAAAASATAGEKLAVTYGNFKEAIGTALLPALDAVSTKAAEVVGWLTENLGPAVDKLGRFFGPVIESVKSFFGGLSSGQGTMSGFTEFVKVEVLPRVAAIGSAFMGMVNVVVPIVKQFVSGLIERIKPMLPTIAAIFTSIGQVIGQAMEFVSALISRVTTIIAYLWAQWGSTILNTIATIFRAVLGVIGPALEVIKSIIRTAIAIVSGNWAGAWDGIKSILYNAWELIKGIINLALTVVKSALSVAWTVIKTAASLAWGLIVGVISGVWNRITGDIGKTITSVKGLLSGAWASIKGVASSAWGGIVTAVASAWGGLLNAIAGPINRAKQFIQENLIDKVNGLFSLLGITFRIGSIWAADNVGRGMSNAGKRNPKNASMYREGGYTGDMSPSSIAGFVHGREYVIKAPATAKLNRDHPGLLDALNGYAAGGYVWPVNARPSFPWGRYPSGGRHAAYDLAVKSGTPVRNPYAGTIIKDGWDNTGYGNHVRIAHDDGRGYSILGHMTREIVAVGQRVAQGQVVGYSGSTGRSSGPHVHWATRGNPYSDATAFDPMRAGGVQAASGGNFIAEFFADTIKSSIAGFGNLTASGLDRLGPWGKLLGGIAKRLTSALGSKAVSLLGLDGASGGGDGIHVGAYDSGGYLHPGWNLAYNGLGEMEPVGKGYAGGGAGRMHPDDIAAIAEAVRDGSSVGVKQGMMGQARVDRQTSRQYAGTGA